MYEWIKALHVIAVITWMAGMLYLPRLFVYHCESETGSRQSETFKVMERRLLKAIINPAMIVTWLAGLYLAWAGHSVRNLLKALARLAAHTQRGRIRHDQFGMLALDLLQLANQRVILRVADLGRIENVVQMLVMTYGFA